MLKSVKESVRRMTSHLQLEFLRSGDAAGAAKRLSLIGKKVVEENILPPIRSWVLEDVVADPKARLNFEYVYSDASGRAGGYIWVYCIKGTDGAWTVRTFNRVD